MPIMITVTDGSSSKGLRIKQELTNLYDLDADKVRDFIKSSLTGTLFDRAITSQMLQDNIEEID